MLSFCSVISNLTSSLLILSLSVGFSFGADPGIPYFSGNLDNLRKEAAQKNLPYVIYFSLPDQLECQQLESETFSYAPLVGYMSSQFLVYHVNAMDGIYAQALIQHYQVKGFPSLLIFGSTGDDWGQIFGFVSGIDLYQEMKRLVDVHQPHRLIATPQWRAGGDHITSSAAAPSRDSHHEGDLVAPAPASLLVQYDPVGRLENENFGIKVGRFTDMNQLEWEVHRYERFWQGVIFAYKEVIHGRDYYILILGGYESLEEADAYALPMKLIAAIDTEIIDLKKLTAGI